MLLQNKHEVVTYDNYTDYGIIDRDDMDALHFERWKYLTCKRVNGDLRNRAKLASAVFGVDTVIHLAASPRAKVVNSFPIEGSEIMSTALLDLLELCKENHVKRFVYISSSMVYGEFSAPIISEEAECHPLGTYAILKYAGELLVKDYCLRNDIEYVIVRPSAVYGPLDVDDRVASKFLIKAMHNEPIIVKGAGELLDFTYVTDTANGICLAATSPYAKEKTYNITYGQARTLLDAAKIAKSVTGSSSEIIVEPKDSMFPSRGTLSIEKAIADLNYSPAINITQGFRLYYAWLKDSIFRP